MGLREFCALLLAGGMGAGSVVGVQEVRRTVAPSKVVTAKPAPPRARPTRPPAAGPRILDCPAVSPLPPGFAVPPALPAGPIDWFAPPPTPGGAAAGGISLPTPPPAAPVPEPARWAMLIAGFGLLGLALRRRPAREPTIRTMDGLHYDSDGRVVGFDGEDGR